MGNKDTWKGSNWLMQLYYNVDNSGCGCWPFLIKVDSAVFSV